MPSLEAVASTRVSPDFFAPVRLPAEAPPQLFVIVDTEEEFDWSAGSRASNVSVTAIDEVGRLQDVLRPYKLKPTYVIDYPVASTPASARRLARFAREGRVPHRRSPPSLGESAVHRAARSRDELRVQPGRRPRAREDFSAARGDRRQSRRDAAGLQGRPVRLRPDDRGHARGAWLRRGRQRQSAHGLRERRRAVVRGLRRRGPGSFGARRRLLEVPCTTAFVGAARRLGATLHRAASASWLQPFKAVGVLARTGTLNKVMLSPEGSTLDEMRRRHRHAHRRRRADVLADVPQPEPQAGLHAVRAHDGASATRF